LAFEIKGWQQKLKFLLKKKAREFQFKYEGARDYDIIITINCVIFIETRDWRLFCWAYSDGCSGPLTLNGEMFSEYPFFGGLVETLINVTARMDTITNSP
jgi:hypothetical protein